MKFIKVVSTIAVASMILAASGTAMAVSGDWMLNAPNAIDFTCGGETYAHTLDTVAQAADGSFSGAGYYEANAGYTWDIVGEVIGDNVTFALVYTGIGSGYTLNGMGTIATDGSIVGTVDGNCQNFAMGVGSASRIEVPYSRNAEITSPTSGEMVYGLVDFEAYLDDDDVDSVQWAVREGTCAAGVGTVFGNVDGHSDVATMNTSDQSNQTFSFTGDMSGMTPGEYCFIYNPVEDSGESNIRKTVEFNLIDKNECKKNGWMSFNNPDFKNQGDCVSYVQSNDKAIGNKTK
jgi:hypothetical protein